MHRPIRTAFSIAAGLALALVALPARADDHERDRDRHGFRAPAAAYPAPYAPVPAPVAAPYYRHAHWRGWELRELRREYQQLDLARDRFYSTWDRNPWSRNRFESWYASRRAELDRRWADLEHQ
jgi:hypothetical protein